MFLKALFKLPAHLPIFHQMSLKAGTLLISSCTLHMPMFKLLAHVSSYFAS